MKSDETDETSAAIGDRSLLLEPGTEDSPSRSGVVFPRLLMGLTVLICAEVFSGASIHVGLWHPWTWLVTFWLYFAHFFFFTTLAVRMLSFATVMAMNSGGPLNLASNLAFMLILLFVIARLARSGLSSSDGRCIVVFGSKGFVGLCVYLILLYGVTYPLLRPDGLPSASIQLLTFVFYAWAIAGLWLHRRRREPLPADMAGVDEWELKRVEVLFATLLVLALTLSVFTGSPVLYLPVVLSFAVWTPLGFLLTVAALLKGARERTASTTALLG